MKRDLVLAFFFLNLLFIAVKSDRVKCNPGEEPQGENYCRACDSGSVSPLGDRCSPCPPGSISTKSFTECSQCPAGTYSTNSINCLSCPSGSISATPGSTTCNKCPAGTIADFDSGYTACKPCPPGKYSTNSISCDFCPTGTISAASGSSTCTECLPGTVVDYDSGFTACKLCPAGTYKTGPVSCGYCPTGTISAAPGSSFCTECPPGTVVDYDSGFTACKSCPAGTYKSGPVSCEECPRGTISATPGSSTCTACPAGTIADFDSRHKACTPCRAGYYSTNSVNCEECPRKTYSEEGSSICLPAYMSTDNDKKIKENIDRSNPEKAKEFLIGVVAQILNDQTKLIKEAAEIPINLINNKNAWSDIDWKDVGKIKEAISATTSAIGSIYDVLDSGLDLSKKFQEKVTTYLKGVNPVIDLIYDAGVYNFKLDEKEADISNYIEGLYDGFKDGNFLEAGKNFASLIQDGLNLKELNNQGTDKSAKFLAFEVYDIIMS